MPRQCVNKAGPGLAGLIHHQRGLPRSDELTPTCVGTLGRVPSLDSSTSLRPNLVNAAGVLGVENRGWPPPDPAQVDIRKWSRELCAPAERWRAVVALVVVGLATVPLT
jgi:hypothetical protein